MHFDTLAIVTVALSLTACSERQANPNATATATSARGEAARVEPAAVPVKAAASVAATPVAQALTIVTDPSQVCMVNNQYMGKPQIPVVVGARTYYGCCEMCKGRLAADASARTATDPVSQRQVDKSQAVMARDAQGTITYFESQANYTAFAARPAR